MKKPIDFNSALSFIRIPQNWERLSKQAQAMISSSPAALRLIPGQVVHRYNMGGSAISNKVHLLLSSNDREVGMTDFQGRKLEDALNCVFNRVRVGYVDDSNNNNEGGVKYTNNQLDWPAVLVNSLIRVEQDNVTVFEQQLIRMIAHRDNDITTSGGWAHTQTENESFPQLNEYGLLAGGKETTIELIVPDGDSFTPSNYGYIELIFDGMITINA